MSGQQWSTVVNSGQSHPKSTENTLDLMDELNRMKEEESDSADENAKKAKKEIVTAEDYDRMMGAVDAINDKESAARCFRRGKPEQIIVWREGDLLCKARPDYWQPSSTGGADRFIDLKTTQDAADFGRTIAKFDYHRQAAWYLRGARVSRCGAAAHA